MGRNRLFAIIIFCLIGIGFFNYFAKQSGSLSQQDFSSLSESSFQKLCALPPQFINQDIFKKYCGSKQCLRPGSTCSLSKSCCSGMCSQGFCLASAQSPALPGEICSISSDCVTNICLPHPFQRRNICYGSSGEFCSRVSDICIENSNCCSGVCSQNRCLGSSQDPAYIGSYCYADHSECESHFCNLQSHRCE